MKADEVLSPSDDELIARVKRDSHALETLYRRHIDRVTAYAARRCDQPADVADLVAATFLAVLESASSFDHRKGDVLPWMIGIASQIHSNRTRRRFRESRAQARLHIELTEDDISTLEARIDAARQAPQVEYALSRLRDSQREALRLVAYDGLSFPEAAHALRISISTLRKRLSRARAALRKELSEESNLLITV